MEWGSSSQHGNPPSYVTRALCSSVDGSVADYLAALPTEMKDYMNALFS
jgi:hypothetical protein